jgi:hypothetical protein
MVTARSTPLGSVHEANGAGVPRVAVETVVADCGCEQYQT